jgi:hypothetical protein
VRQRGLCGCHGGVLVLALHRLSRLRGLSLCAPSALGVGSWSLGSGLRLVTGPSVGSIEPGSLHNVRCANHVYACQAWHRPLRLRPPAPATGSGHRLRPQETPHLPHRNLDPPWLARPHNFLK